MQEKQLDKESMKGTIYVLLSAVCFSTGGVLIKSIPWSSITIQGIRSIFSFMLIASYMAITKRKFVWNKTVLFGAVCNTVMALTFVSATKMTTAANAIVLQFTEPIFVILLMWALYKKKPKKAAVIACAVVFAGILCFFLDSLSAGGMAGNLLAVFSGFTYALVMMMKGFPGSDFCNGNYDFHGKRGPESVYSTRTSDMGTYSPNDQRFCDTAEGKRIY